MKVVITAPVAVLKADDRRREAPLTVVKSPPTYTREPSGGVDATGTCPLSTGGEGGSRSPGGEVKASR